MTEVRIIRGGKGWQALTKKEHGRFTRIATHKNNVTLQKNVLETMPDATFTHVLAIELERQPTYKNEENR
jgi:hypothetical protein